MPKTFVLLQFNIDDPETFARYRQSAAPTIMSNGGKVLVAANQGDVREGSLPARLTTILEFASRDAAEGWYTSSEYSSFKHLRHEATSAASVVFLDGFEPPVGTGEK